jgi:hypothetical protein
LRDIGTGRNGRIDDGESRRAQAGGKRYCQGAAAQGSVKSGHDLQIGCEKLPLLSLIVWKIMHLLFF